MMGNVCPLLKQECIKGQCAWWSESEFEDGTKDGKCAVVSMNEHMEELNEEEEEKEEPSQQSTPKA